MRCAGGFGDFGLAIGASNELGEMESGLAAAFLGATGAVVLGGPARWR
jgi:hypothetical protein